MLFFAQGARVKSIGKAPILARITDQKIAGDMDTLASKIGGQHPTPPEPSAMSKGTTTKARNLQNGLRTLTPGLSPAKKREAAVLPDGRFACISI